MGPQRCRRGSGGAGVALAQLLLAAAGASCADPAAQGHLGWTPPELDAERRCQQGAVAACGELGRSLVARSDGGRDQERGLVLLEVACGQDDLPSCASLGRMYIDRTHAKSRARARELLDRTCARGSGEACTALAAVRKMDGADRAEVAAALEKGCGLGDALGCELYGEAQWHTFGAGRARGEEAFGKACALGRLSSCHVLAAALARNPERHATGLELLEKNCGHGYVRSCSVLAANFAPVVGPRPDCRLALPFAQRACAGKDVDACSIAAACALAGPERATALADLRAACERGVGTSCLYWADAAGASAGAGADGGAGDAGDGRVEKAYEIACNDGSPAAPVACPRLAVMVLARANLSDDAERALAILREACERASGEACCGLADEYQRGKWVPGDAAKAGELRTKACTLGQPRCCATPQ
jgi:TPR repeat protein